MSTASVSVAPVPWIMDRDRQGRYECADCGHFVEVFAADLDSLPGHLTCCVCGWTAQAVWYTDPEPEDHDA